MRLVYSNKLYHFPHTLLAWLCMSWFDTSKSYFRETLKTTLHWTHQDLFFYLCMRQLTIESGQIVIWVNTEGSKETEHSSKVEIVERCILKWYSDALITILLERFDFGMSGRIKNWHINILNSGCSDQDFMLPNPAAYTQGDQFTRMIYNVSFINVIIAARFYENNNNNNNKASDFWTCIFLCFYDHVESDG